MEANDGEQSSGDALLTLVAQTKRQAVPTACEQCRKRKSKCDGARPCRSCARRKVECIYETEGDETPRDAKKRRFEELTQSNGSYHQLYTLLASGSQSEAEDLFRRIRSGEPVESILQNPLYGQTLASNYEQQLKQKFIYTAIQSTGTLREILSLVAGIFNSTTRIDIPGKAAYDPLRHCIITLEGLSGVLLKKPPRQIPDGSDTGPPFWVPCDPWISLIENDEAVSHLVSIFFIYLNPYWRCVEQDLFIHAMRSKRPSPFCSSLLVHAILAYASLYSEIDEAYTTRDQPLTRGLNFHNEAVRLWNSERRHSSIATIQAGMIMSIECGFRGQDEFSYGVALESAELWKSLDIPDMPMFTRIKVCLSNLVPFSVIAESLGTARGIERVNVEPDAMQEIATVLPNTIVYWTGYPYRLEPLPLRMNLLTRERRKITLLNWEILNLLYAESSSSLEHDTPRKAKALLSKWSRWWNTLDPHLSQMSRMPIPIFDFHAHYYATQMTLCIRILNLMAQSKSNKQSGTDEWTAYALEFREIRLQLSHDSATLVSRLREQYGSKIVPALGCHMASVSCSILLQEMPQNEARAEDADDGVSAQTRKLYERSEENAQAIDQSFEECFRCLLSAGMDNLFPRAIVRMVFQTARQMNVRLPTAVEQMLQYVADTAWQKSDIQYYRSAYPNHAVVNASKIEQASYAMEDMLGKWDEIEIEDRAIMKEMSQSEQSVEAGLSFT